MKENLPISRDLGKILFMNSLITKFFKRTIFLLAVFTLCCGAFAQDAGGGAAGGGGSEEDIIQQSLGDLTLVGIAGVGGAVLGLSTLSFVETPKDHLDNVLVGGAIGIIVGVGIVAYFQAVKSNSKYQEADEQFGFNTLRRYDWGTESHKNVTLNISSSNQLSYQVSF